MRIEFWVDYLCPITYLTHKNLIAAIEETKLNDYEILYRSFEMIDYDDKLDYDIMDVWMIHHNVRKEEVINILKHIYPDYQKLKYVNVNGAHQLSHLAKRYDVAKKVNILIMEAFFEDGKDISNIDILCEIGVNAGIPKAAIIEAINQNTFREQIELNRENAFIKDIDRIPHIRINVKSNFNGLLSKDKLKEILNETKLNKPNFTYCNGGVCSSKKA